VAAQVTVEIPWQIFVSAIGFFCWYYPVGFYHDASYEHAVVQRGGLMYFYVLAFFIYIPSMAQMCIAGMELADTAANICNMLFTLCLLFCGVLATKEALPGFWVFMYRVSPFNYLISGMLSVGIANSPVVCAARELIQVSPPPGMTCQQYLEPYFEVAGGYVANPDATSNCNICSLSDTNTFLSSIGSFYDQRWRNLGIFISFIAFNYAMAFFLYWLARVPKSKDRFKKTKSN
jgi:ATP-binding cassette subfamily G (WHITE) protein 2 (PDR)